MSDSRFNHIFQAVHIDGLPDDTIEAELRQFIIVQLYMTRYCKHLDIRSDAFDSFAQFRSFHFRHNQVGENDLITLGINVC